VAIELMQPQPSYPDAVQNRLRFHIVSESNGPHCRSDERICKPMISSWVFEFIRNRPTGNRDSRKTTDNPDSVIRFQVRVLQQSRRECPRLRSASHSSMYQGLSRGSCVWRQDCMSLQELN